MAYFLKQTEENQEAKEGEEEVKDSWDAESVKDEWDADSGDEKAKEAAQAKADK